MLIMVDEDKPEVSGFGFTNQDGDVERVTYEIGGIVSISCNVDYYRIHPEDVPKMIKALEHMHKYLVDEKLI